MSIADDFFDPLLNHCPPVYRINWFTAKSRLDRLKEEECLLRHEMKWTAQAFATLAERWLGLRKSTPAQAPSVGGARQTGGATSADVILTVPAHVATPVGPEPGAHPVGAAARTTPVGPVTPARTTPVGPGVGKGNAAEGRQGDVQAGGEIAYHTGYSFYAGYWARVFGELAEDAHALWQSTQNVR